MADSMDLVQQRVEEERQRTSTPPATERRALPVCFALIAMHRSRQLAAVLFRACSIASPVRKSQS